MPRLNEDEIALAGDVDAALSASSNRPEDTKLKTEVLLVRSIAWFDDSRQPTILAQGSATSPLAKDGAPKPPQEYGLFIGNPLKHWGVQLTHAVDTNQSLLSHVWHTIPTTPVDAVAHRAMERWALLHRLDYHMPALARLGRAAVALGTFKPNSGSMMKPWLTNEPIENAGLGAARLAEGLAKLEACIKGSGSRWYLMIRAHGEIAAENLSVDLAITPTGMQQPSPYRTYDWPLALSLQVARKGVVDRIEMLRQDDPHFQGSIISKERRRCSAYSVQATVQPSQSSDVAYFRSVIKQLMQPESPSNDRG